MLKTIIAFLSLYVLLTGCDQLLPPPQNQSGTGFDPTSGTTSDEEVKNAYHFPEACNLMLYIDNKKLDVNARKLCAGQQVNPVPFYLYNDMENCAPNLRTFYMKAVTNISIYAFDDHIAEKSTHTLLNCGHWFFEVASSPCIEESDMEIWADNTILLLRETAWNADGELDAKAAERFLRKLKVKLTRQTVSGKKAYERFEKIILENWKDYLKNNGQPV